MPTRAAVILKARRERWLNNPAPARLGAGRVMAMAPTDQITLRLQRALDAGELPAEARQAGRQLLGS